MPRRLLPHRRRRIAVSAAVAASAALVLGGCFGEPEGPDSAAGTRIVGDDVQFWLGGACSDVTSIDVDLRDEKRTTLDTWSVESTGNGAATIETFTAGVAPNGFTETDSLEIDASAADIAVATITRADGAPVEVVAQLTVLLGEPTPDDDSWRLVYRGWVDAEDVDNLINDGELAPACT